MCTPLLGDGVYGRILLQHKTFRPETNELKRVLVEARSERKLFALKSKGKYTTGRLLAEAKANGKAHVDEVTKYFAKGAGGKAVKKVRHYFSVSSSTAQRVQKVTVMEEHDSRPH